MINRDIRVSLCFRLDGDEAVPRVGRGAAACDGWAGEAAEGGDGAGHVGAVLARELEADALDARVVLAQCVVGDVDVFVRGGVGGSAAVGWVGAVGGLGGGGCEGSGGEEGGSGDELHLDGFVVVWVLGWIESVWCVDGSRLD